MSVSNIRTTPQYPAQPVSAGIYNAAAFGEIAATTEQRIQLAINAAAADAKKQVWIPSNMTPYNASLITYNNAVQLIREGGDPTVWDIRAYGADNTGADPNSSNSTAINAAITAAGQSRVLAPAGGYSYTSPIILKNDVHFVGVNGFGFGTNFIPFQCDAFYMRGADNIGGQVFRITLEHLAITMTSAADKIAITEDSGYSCIVRDVFVYNVNTGTGISINAMKAPYLYNTQVYGQSVGSGVGIEINSSDVHAYGVDVENFLNCIRIGNTVQTDNCSTFHGGYVERFGQYGVRFVNTRGNSLLGMTIKAPNAGSLPVGFVGTGAGFTCQNNKVIGGQILGDPAGNAYVQNAFANNNMLAPGVQVGGNNDGGNAFCLIRDGVTSGLDLQIVTPPALAAGNTNDYNLYNVVGALDVGMPNCIRVSANAAGSVLTGIANGHPGHQLKIVNISTNSLTLSHLNGASVAANRITLPSLADMILGPNQTVELVYDGASTTWRMAATFGIAGLTLKKGSGAGNYTTASTSYVAVDGTNLALTVTIPIGFKLKVQAAGSIGTNTAVATASFAIADGGVVLQESQVNPTVAGTAGLESFSLAWVIAGDGASHVVDLRYKTSVGADTALLLNSSATLTPSLVFELVPSY